MLLVVAMVPLSAGLIGEEHLVGVGVLVYVEDVILDLEVHVDEFEVIVFAQTLQREIHAVAELKQGAQGQGQPDHGREGVALEVFEARGEVDALLVWVEPC